MHHISYLHSELFEGDVMEIWDYKRSVDQYNVTGGTGKDSVHKQIQELTEWLSKA